jgi:nucleotide-binding universal stress UspA family protein
MAYDIVVGVDTSEASKRAVQFACRLQSSDLVGAMLLVHVVPWSPFSFNTPQENEQRHAKHETEVKATEEQVLHPMHQVAEELGGTADVMVRHGDPVAVLEEIAKQESARLVVVGRTGDTGIRERIFGGLPSHLVQSSEVPVVVVP